MNSKLYMQQHFMPILGAIILASVTLWGIFSAIDGLFLDKFKAQAIIIRKEYVPVSQGTFVRMINGKPQTSAIIKPESYILRLRLENTTAIATVSRNQYETLVPGNTIIAICQKHRITHKVYILEILNHSTLTGDKKP